MTSETSTEALRALTRSLAASLARTSPEQAAGPGSAAPAGASGSSSPVPFAYYDRESSSSRTSPTSPPRPVWLSTQESLLSESSWPTWPKRGTWASGSAYELPTSALPTAETDSSSLLPTPDASVFNDGQSVEAYRDRKQRELEKNYNGNGGGTPLAMAVRLLPTPSANDDTGAEKETREARQAVRTGGPSLRDLPRLLPTGEPSGLPWLSGSDSSDEPPQDQLTITGG